MSLYAIGDVQGCFNALEKLLDLINFSAAEDELWFTGDLVNRGPQSLETLRFVRRSGSKSSCVLGNHDVQLLKVDAGIEQAPEDGTLDAILQSPEREELIDWLRRRPLFILDQKRKLALVHAGLAPSWNLETAKNLSEKIEQKLQSENYREFLAESHHGTFDRWHPKLNETAQLHAAFNTMTYMRCCERNGRMNRRYKKAPGEQPETLQPWFDWPHRRGIDVTVIFGHWAALGFLRRPGLAALDTGCVWKEWQGQLTAYRFDPGNEKRFSVSC